MAPVTGVSTRNDKQKDHKKTSKKKSKKKTHPGLTVNPQKKSNTSITQKAAGDIDDIFSAVPKKKQSQETSEKNKQTKQTDDAVNPFSSGPVPIRIDKETGFPVYTEESLGISDKGGDTPDCPFDCSCCF